jgi:PqqD family protein of HPr-rel-A system
MGANIKWRARSGLELHVRSWGDEVVVYDNLSGDTHLLDSIAAKVLLKLQHAPSDMMSLADMLVPVLQTEISDESLEYQLGNILADLNAIALIERT